MRKGFLLALVASLASAEAPATTYSSAVTIAMIETVDTDGTARVFLTFTTRPHVTTCANDNPTQAFWRLGGNAENQRNMIAVATAAHLAERQIKVLFVDSYSGAASCDGGGTAGYPVISGIEML